jgi:hypothetical protein
MHLHASALQYLHKVAPGLGATNILLLLLLLFLLFLLLLSISDFSTIHLIFRIFKITLYFPNKIQFFYNLQNN